MLAMYLDTSSRQNAENWMRTKITADAVVAKHADGSDVNVEGCTNGVKEDVFY